MRVEIFASKATQPQFKQQMQDTLEHKTKNMNLINDNKKFIGYGLCGVLIAGTGIMTGRAAIKNINLKKVQKAYSELFNQVSLNNTDTGLNRVIGHKELKEDIVNNFFMPLGDVIIRKDNELAQKNALPNGLVLSGNSGTGKKYIMNAIGEHAEKLGMKFVKPEIVEGDSIATAQNIRDAFKQAETDFRETGNYTFILMDKMNNYAVDRRTTLDNLKEVSALLKFTENSSKRGAIWLGIADDIKTIDKALLDRATMISPLRPMNNMELCDTLEYTLSKEKDLNSGTIDYKKILAKLNETKERYSPKQMAQVAQDAIAQSKQTKEQLTTESLLAILEKQTAKNIDDGAVKQFNEDLAYLRSEGFIPPKSPDFEL